MKWTPLERHASFAEAIAWNAAHAPSSILRFGESDQIDAQVGYAEFAALVWGAAQWLERQGCGPESSVGVIAVSSLPAAVCMCATLVRGATLVPLAHRQRLRSGTHHYEALVSALRAGMPRWVLAPAKLLESLRAVLGAAPGSRAVDFDEVVSHASPPPLPPARGAAHLLQLSSGSTSQPKPILLGEDQLLANIRGIVERIAGSGADHTYTWLPLYHDMGLVGGLFTSIHAGASLTLASPAHFVKDPLSWIESLSRLRCSVTLGPPSALQLLAAKLATNPPRGAAVDLSALRIVLTGSEMVPAGLNATLRDALGPLGLRDDVVQPCYGLAENAVAVTLREPGRPWAILHFERRALQAGRALLLEQAGPDAVTRVGNGSPITGTEVFVGKMLDGAPSPSDCGALYVRGTSLAEAIDGRETGGAWVATGDLAAIVEGELFVLGRLKELVKINGQAFAPIDLEIAISVGTGLPAEGIGAVGVIDEAREREDLVVFIECAEACDRTQLEMEARRALLRAFRLPAADVVFVPRLALPRTSSGKLKRAELAERYAEERRKNARVQVPGLDESAAAGPGSDGRR